MKWQTVWTAARRPRSVARVVWLVGAITLISAIAPGMGVRLHYIRHLVPDAFPAAATTGAAAIGILLMLLARALRRGKYRAWVVATVLSGVGAVAHVIKGLDLEEATISLAVFGYLLAVRRGFTARAEPRSRIRVMQAVVLGPVVAAAVGTLWLSIDARGQASGSGFLDRLTQASLGLVGIPGPLAFRDPREAHEASVALVVLGFFALLTILLVALQPAGGPHPADASDRTAIEKLLGAWGGLDSLSYFSLRDDRCVAFAASGKSALTYRVVGSVSLAAGDPIGDPEAWGGAIKTWLDEAHSYGWTPAVLGTSERGAQAFHRAGFDALELGDEAIVHIDGFTLEGRAMRGIRQAVSRCQRAQITVATHRVRDLTTAETEEIVAAADAWRDGEVERGFSMALGRFGEARDPDTVVVVARDAAGALHGVLHFVPWGSDGLSLDLMRRDRESENGLIEAMVAQLLTDCPALGVARVSLNFAVFRSVFARGERLGAGPVLRIWRTILLWLSRFWQIESLYRANAKYHPQWEPRFICFIDSSDLPQVGVAALRAEAFIVAPAWWRRLVKG